MTAGATVGIVLLIGAIILTAWSPIFALIIFVIAAVLLAAGAAARRSGEYVEGAEGESSQAGAGPVQEADVLGAKAADRGAPARGEGGSGGAQTLPPPTRP